VRSIAINELSAALSEGAGIYAKDNDPELVRAALPFGLKLTEALLEEKPTDRGLLTTAASGFTQFSFAFVEQDADQLEARDLKQATRLRRRAVGLYLRARDYGLRGLDAAHPGFTNQLRSDAAAAVARCRRGDVPLLYWTAASWAAAMALSKDRPEQYADQPLVEAMIDRALLLDESFDRGAIHTFLISYEMARPGQSTTGTQRARAHFDRAVELSRHRAAGPLVALAETVAVAQQNRNEFESLLKQAIAINVNDEPETRLANLIMQERARWLLTRTDELFVD
jgi:predicted anti-sigma-YlaC factor YlaD